MNFSERYKNLNPAQKQAVDTIDGPVMVIAGPGTGKTELLSVRVANILQKTDTLPENILCLTFTESGAMAMRERLTNIIGKDAYRVAIHTFHSFGTEVINQNGEYFYKGATYKPADELSSFEILEKIFELLPYNNPLASKNYNEFTYIHDTFSAISDIKRSGLSSSELIEIIDANESELDQIEPTISEIFNNRISKKTVESLSFEIKNIQLIKTSDLENSIINISQIIIDSINDALAEADQINKTTPITAWKNNWLEKNKRGELVFKSRARSEKLRAVAEIYQKYIDKMHESKLFDFDDMILEVIQKIESNSDLKFNIQEKYQYILVDEFQDTNLAQMRILKNLTDNPVNEDTPNIMVVGDDDQAIYSFQGADVSNIIEFRNNFPKCIVITLTENYRSTEQILSKSRRVIEQGSDRLEKYYSDINKQLSANQKSIPDGFEIISLADSVSERAYIATDIKKRIDSGESPNSITILTRQHSEIQNILPYLYNLGIKVNYERHNNILDEPIIKYLEKLSKLLIEISRGNNYEANALIPEILAHESWQINPIDIWKLSLKASETHTFWIENMEISTKLHEISTWLINTAFKIADTPLEEMLDILVGKNEHEPDEFVSPIYEFYFSSTELSDNPEKYLLYLNCLKTLRSKLRDYSDENNMNLIDFINFISKNRQIGAVINISENATNFSDAINVMTAHKSKGLEYDRVYIINAIDNIWGETKRKRSKLISYPENLPIGIAGETSDERLRLFYVAMTRAKKYLTISFSDSNDKEKETLATSFIVGDEFKINKINKSDNLKQVIQNEELDWYQKIVQPESPDLKKLLSNRLDNYKLSVTHFHNFLDVTRGGPMNFLMQNLLQFPQSKNASAGFGTAIHNTMQFVSMAVVNGEKRRTIDEIASFYTTELTKQFLTKNDYEKYLQKGIDSLKIFFEQKYDIFNINQKTELSFANQNSIINNAHLTGKLDLIEINKGQKAISVLDYKTGKAIEKPVTEIEKIKIHRQKQQLIFYKLLVENSRDYRQFTVNDGTIQFIEPTKFGDIVSNNYSFNSDEVEYLKQLIEAVWNKIINLDLPDISSYPQTLKGIQQFEEDLIDGKI